MAYRLDPTSACGLVHLMPVPQLDAKLLGSRQIARVERLAESGDALVRPH